MHPAAARMPPELVARDALLGWYRGEFAAANAIIDALCGHLAQICGEEGAPEYGAVFAAIHRRRMNWIPVLHMQQHVSIADVTSELRRVAASRAAGVKCPAAAAEEEEREITPPPSPEAAEEDRAAETETVAETTAVTEKEEEEAEEDASGGDGGSQVGHDSPDSVRICANHEDCAARPDRIKILKGFVAKEPVKGHMVNIVKGLKLYEDIFTNAELMKLGELINELRLAGRKGELSDSSAEIDGVSLSPGSLIWKRISYLDSQKQKRGSIGNSLSVHTIISALYTSLSSLYTVLISSLSLDAGSSGLFVAG